MRRIRRGAPEPGAIDLLEEAAHLLRVVPSTVHAFYLIGTVPFLLGLMFFIAEMSRGANAGRILGDTAFGMVILFGWMKVWQSLAAEHALAALEQRLPKRTGLRAVLSLAVHQVRVHAFGLVALPVALIVAIPFGWVFAYYQSATVLGVSTGARLHRASLEQARLWPRQNHLLLALITVMGFVVLLNIAVSIYFVPYLARSIFGIDNLFATTGWNPFNTTFLTIAACVAFVVVDPFCKAVYVLRCYYGASRRTGVDLLVRIRGAMAERAAQLAVLAVAFLAFTCFARAADASRETPEHEVLSEQRKAIDPDELDEAVGLILEAPEFSWRLPREEAEEDEVETGIVGRFVQSIAGWTRSVVRWIGELVEKLLNVLFRDRKQEVSRTTGTSGLTGLVALLGKLLPILAALLLIAVIWLVWRWWSQSRAAVPAVEAPKVEQVLEREDVTADQLPEDEWLRLAREMFAKGETRLAMRALFLGSLASLGARGALILARYKSNRDYERELARRGANEMTGGLVPAFSSNRRVLEHVWYGSHQPEADEVERFKANAAQLREGSW